MRCRHCNEKISTHDLWCVKCGKRTEVLRTNLSAIKSLKETWNNYKSFRGANMPAGIIATLIGVIPLIALMWLLNFAIPAMPYWQFIILHVAVWTLFIPTMIVPFKAVCKSDTYKIDIALFLSAFRSYSGYLLLTLLSVLFYVVIYYVCQGDPILNLVWLVLVLYWIAIVLPVPVLMQRYRINAFRGIYISYKLGGDVRWNIFLLAIILYLVNIIAAILLVIGLAVTVPYTWFAIRDYTDKLIDFEVFGEKVSK